jgi:1-phosphofructokinase family hexose kinase
VPSQPVYTVTLNPGLDRTLTVPEMRDNEVLRATESRLDWGGKGFNVSRALAALEVNSLALGFVGGAVGTRLERGLNDLGIATEFVEIDGETRTNTVVLEQGTGRYLKVNEAGPNVRAQEMNDLLARVEEIASPDSLWTLCGSLPPGLSVDTYARLIELIQGAGGRVFLDTSGDALIEGCEAQPYLAKPNAEEAAMLTGTRIETVSDALRASRYLLDMGVQTVALSMGADGLVYATEGGAVHAKPPAVAVKTVVGVGDALLAGLLYGLFAELDESEIARWGVAAGTAAAMGAGVCVGTLPEVMALRQRVTIKRLV